MLAGKYRVCGMALLLLLSLLLLVSCSGKTQAGLRVVVLDVGQSDAILVTQGEHHLLIDTGTVSECEALLGNLSLYRVKNLDYLLLSHPHEDHAGNARAVIERFNPGALLTSSAGSDETFYLTALEAAKKENFPHNVMRKGESFSLGEAKCEVLFAGDGGQGDNNDSIVLRITYRDCSFLFMGDAEQEVEEQLLQTYTAEQLDCDFIKIGHHGSRNSSSLTFLKVVSPELAAISCGEDNSYGFPHKEVLERLAEVGAACRRTDQMGSLVYECDGETLRCLDNTKVIARIPRKEELA